MISLLDSESFMGPPAPGMPKMLEMLAYFGAAIVMSLIGTMMILRSKSSIGLDAPDGRRKQHEKPIPRLGGLPIFIALAVCISVSLWLGRMRLDEWGALLLCNLLMFLVGFLDDLKPLGAKVKLMGQIGVSLILYSLGVSIDILSNPFGAGGLMLGWWSLPLTLFWLVAIPNIINLIDGMDGLAGGFGLFLSLTLAFVGYVSIKPDVMLISIIMAGALSGFLFFNFPPAKIFLGDGGAYLIGFFVASVSLTSSNKGSVIAALLVIVIALGVPILDTAFAILRRSIRGVPIFSADAEHIHHRLILLGYSKGRALVAMYSVCVVLSLVGISILLTKGIALPIAGAVLFLLALGAARYLGYIRSWSKLREQISHTLTRRRRLEHIRAHARVLEFDIEQCASLSDFSDVLRHRFRWIGFNENRSADSQVVILPLKSGLQCELHCPLGDGLQSDWFHRADVFTGLFERCLELWGTLPEFVLPQGSAPIDDAQTHPETHETLTTLS
ncbi:MAG: MraY family glycosyltransferase [Verrucomicrobia bacterium]|nr:MraY family glycosyltransferase [Verrucomicrobiota bacterium]